MDPNKIQILPEEKDRKRKMLSALSKGKKSFFYCITGSKNGILEIVPSWVYLLSGQENVLLGLAGTYANALKLTEQMIGRVYRDTNTFDVRGYFG